MIEDQHGAATGDTLATEGDPVGEVTIPLSRREIARAHALAGVTLGLSAMFGILGTLDTSSVTK